MRLPLLLLAALLGAARAEDMYCGTDNCYDVLDVPADAAPGDIRSAYRRLALEFHPDKNKAEGAVERFRAVAAAYEVLGDADRRQGYDYYLAHPEERWRNSATYYRYRYGPKTDARVVLGVLVALLSVAQYAYQGKRHRRFMAQFEAQRPALRAQKLAALRAEPETAAELREREAAAAASAGGQQQGKGRAKEAARQAFAAELEARVDDAMAQAEDLVDGAGRKPNLVDDVFAVQLALLPVRVARWAAWRAGWFWRYTVQKEEYSAEDREYLTRSALGLSEGRWAQAPSAERERMLAARLWEPGSMERLRAEAAEEFKAKNPNKWKRYQRFKKKRR